MLLIALLLAAAPPPPPPSLAPLMGPLQPQVEAAPVFNPLGKGSAAVSFVLPGDVGQAAVGVTYLMADNFAARVDFGLDAILSPSGQPATFSIDLAVRWYNWKRGPVALFLSPSFGFGRSLLNTTTVLGGTNVITAVSAGEFISFGGAAGAEYFFTEHLSAGGLLGLSLRLSNIGGDANSSIITSLSTATSGLFANFYF
jgi:hypothetical protein